MIAPRAMALAASSGCWTGALIARCGAGTGASLTYIATRRLRTEAVRVLGRHDAASMLHMSSSCAASLVSGNVSGAAVSTQARFSGTAPSVRSTTDSGVAGAAVYESDRAVNEYLQFHYAPDDVLMPHKNIGIDSTLGFRRRCVELALNTPEKGRVLDIGCAVGGMSFELARHFNSVLGIDFSHALIAAAENVKKTGECTYTLNVEGAIKESITTPIDAAIDRSRCSFQQGDACSLPSDIGTFDAVLAANLLCRLPEPAQFLSSCASIVKSGGVLVLVSPYSWLPEYTSKEKWIGGQAEGPLTSFDELSKIMKTLDFKLEERKEMPFLMRDHARKFGLSVSDGTVWRRAAD